MAVLEKIREKTVLVLVMIGLGMFGFLFMGSDQSSIFSCNGQQENSIGSVNGEEIDIDNYNEYYATLDTLTKPGPNLDVDGKPIRIKKHTKEESYEIAWDSLVNEKLSNSAASDLGLVITPEELKELETSTNPKNISPFFKKFIEDNFKRAKKSLSEIKKNNPDDTTTIQYDQLFVDINGNFSRDAVEVFLANANRDQWTPEHWFLKIEDNIAKERLAEKYQILIEKGMYTTNSELNERAQNATVEYVSIPYPAEEVEVTEEEISAYYKNNIASYQNKEETRDAEYVAFTVVPSTEDTEKIKEDMIFEGKKVPQDFVNIKKCISLPYKKESDITDTNFTKLIKKAEGTVEGPYKFTNGKYRLAKLIKKEDRPDSIRVSYFLIGTTDSILKHDDLIYRAKKAKEQYKEGADTIVVGNNSIPVLFEPLDWSTESNFKSLNSFLYFSPSNIDSCFTSTEIDPLKIITITIDAAIQQVYLIKVDTTTKLIPKYKIAYLDKEVVATNETWEESRSKAINFITLARDKGLVQKSSKPKNKFLQYWWLLLDISIILILFYFIYIKKKSVRRFVPYAILLAILATGAGIYFGSKSEEDITILKDNMQESVLKSLVLSDSNDYEYREAPNINNMQFNIGLDDDSREIVKWMFDEKTKVGDVSSRVYECGDKFLVVSLSAINNKGDKTLESVRNIIEQEIQIDKKFDAISNQLSESPTLSEASSLEGASSKITVNNVNFADPYNIGIDNQDLLGCQNFVGAVNAMMDKGANRLIKGKNSAYVIISVSKNSGEISEDIETLKENSSIYRSKSNNVYDAVLKVLKENSDIVDNRFKFY